MVIVELLQWWYGRGYKHLVKTIRLRLVSTIMLFSVPLLLSTLFAPWKRIVSGGGLSIADKFRVILDNLISRVVGFVVRSLTLLTAALAVTVVAIFGIITLIAWPLLPPAALALLIRGVLPW